MMISLVALRDLFALDVIGTCSQPLSDLHPAVQAPSMSSKLMQDSNAKWISHDIASFPGTQACMAE